MAVVIVPCYGEEPVVISSEDAVAEDVVPESAPAAAPLAPRQPSIPPRPALPAPVVPVGPTEADFETARRIRSDLVAFIEETRAQLELADETVARVEAELDELSSQLGAAVSRTRDADRIHDVITERLTTSRRALRDALESLGRSSDAPQTTAIDDVSRRRSGQAGENWTRLAAEIGQLRKEAVELESQLRWINVAIAGDTFHRVTVLASGSFEKISLEKRDQIFGTSREGLQQLVSEVKQLMVAARYYFVVRAHDLQRAPALARDYFVLGELLLSLLRLFAVLAFALFFRARWRDWLSASRGPLFRWLTTIQARRRLERLFGLLEVGFPWLLLFVTLHFSEWALSDYARTFEARFALGLLYYYAAYRLAIDLVVAGIQRISARYELDVQEERQRLTRRSVITFFRVVFALAVLNLVSGRLFGGGYLSQIAARFSGVIVAITLVVLMLHWRRELADAFLVRHPAGRISDLVRSTRDSFLGILVAPASFIWILGRAMTAVARDFAMGFEQTQRALAFLFRRRIEKEAERRGYAAGDLAALPDKCCEAFTEDAVERGAGLVELFPGLDLLQADLSAWRDRREDRSFLLTGQRGVGKTTWLRQIRRSDVPIRVVCLAARTTSRDELSRVLADPLESSDPTFEGLVRHLVGGEPQVVVLDDAHHLFLATVGGFEAWAALAELINRTRSRVFWVCSMSAYAWKHLRAAREDWTVFARQVHLPPWSEHRIRDLLRARMKASGLHYNYSSLALERLEGVSTRDHLIESADGYARLLWDYSDGNPRVAVHFFLRSLDPDSENRLKVRLFRAPEVERLVTLGETAFFILACIVTHESISVAHIADATRYPHSICRIHLDKFLVEGMVSEENGHYRITTHWQRAVIRTLRRRNILTV